MLYKDHDFKENFQNELRYLKLLSNQYKTIADACTEIINLQAIINLPKGTEHFLSDIHGEYESFIHVLKNASGVIKRKITEMYGNSLRQEEIKNLATLIYYPEQKLEMVLKTEENIEDWYKITLHRLISICRFVSSKYTRSKVRKALPSDFSYIIDELLNEQPNRTNKEDYYNEIIRTIIKIGRGNEFIISISKVIQTLVIDRLHIVGDIFDRGPGADIIMDTLINYHSVDIQWGNHDIVWMGAAAGSTACIATVIRTSTRYGNLRILEDGYGINLLPLATFAMEAYKDDNCTEFIPKIENGKQYSSKELSLLSKIHKAITIIQFKLEGEVIKRRPSFHMENRLLLDKINYAAGTITLGEKTYKLKDSNFPTINPKHPYALTHEEAEIVEKLKESFVNSEKLQTHVSFLFAQGSLYLKCNSNLLYHGCIPLNDDGSFKGVSIGKSGKKYSGKAYLDRLDILVREGYFYNNNLKAKQYGMDIIWYLWNGPDSPLFGKDKMATFERYFIDDKTTHHEKKNQYFNLENSEKACNIIFEEFGLDPSCSHIINGHVPVRIKQGESPIKANGKLLVIDGGFSRAYQPETGIAGYTLIYNSYGLSLVSHEPFESAQKAIEEGKDILSTRIILETEVDRMKVADTDIGKDLKLQIEDLERLLDAYRKGVIKEQITNKSSSYNK